MVLSLELITLYFREADDGLVHRVQDGALRVVSPLQEGSARAIEPFRDGWNWVADLFDAKAENERLRAEVEDLRAIRSRHECSPVDRTIVDHQDISGNQIFNDPHKMPVFEMPCSGGRSTRSR